MPLVIQVSHQFNRIAPYLKGFSEVAIKKATVQAVNRVALTARKEGANIASRELALPKGKLKSYFDIQKARYSRAIPIGQIYSTLNASSRPISLINFVKGDKNPRPQKGIPVNKRRKLVVEVKKGTKVVLPKAFIARSSRGGAIQVFRRGKGEKLIKQSVPSMFVIFNKPDVSARIRSVISSRFKIEFDRSLAYYARQIPKPRAR